MDVIPSTNGVKKPAHSSLGRHVCHFAGCAKTFLRKEHLTRHEKSHAAERSYGCHICQRGFNRNDILQRHLSRHKVLDGATDRNGRACDACHNSKVRCEGGFPCSTCTKRGIECKIDREEMATIKHLRVYDKSASPPTNVAQDVGTGTNSSSQTSGSSAVEYISCYITTTDRNQSSVQVTVAEPSFGYPMGATTDHISPIAPLGQGQNKNPEVSVGMSDEQSFSQKFDDLRFRGTTAELLIPFRSIPDSITVEYYESYQTYFHPRWPIIHLPSFESEEEPYMLKASVEMIGAWLHGTCPSILVSLTLHDRLSNYIFQKLYQRPACQDRYKAWPMALYQSAMLNIIFGIYSGKDNIVSRCIIFQNILLASLREIGFFQPEIASLKEKTASFYPFIMSKREERKRLMIALFKVECYLSTIRTQPMTLQPEELNFTLPCTYSTWNAAGLHILQHRYPEEPPQRNQESLLSIITDGSYSSVTQPFLLIEDIQFGLCAIQSDIWRHIALSQSSKQDDVSSLNRKRSLRERLDSWKQIIDHTIVEEYEKVTVDQMSNKNFIPMKYYYGVEDHSKPEWPEIVSNRVQSLLTDTRLLYHVLCLNVNINIPIISMSAKSKKERTNSDIPQVAKEQEDKIRQWTRDICSRESLWHAAVILDMHQPGNDNLTPQLRLINGGLDPIAHVAIALAAIVVWGYSFYNENKCAFCAGPSYASPPVELMDLVTRNAELEKFIEVGSQAMINGIMLCPCNIERLMEKFQECLPSGSWKWEMASTLAPILPLRQ